MAHDDDYLYLAYQIKDSNLPPIGSWGFNTYLDTDSTDATGYRTDGVLGADFLAQANSLYQYTGDGLSWSWTEVGTVNRTVGANAAEIRIDRNLIGNPQSLYLNLVGDNASLDGTQNDFYPDKNAGTSGEGFYTYATGQLIIDAAPLTMAFALPGSGPINGRLSDEISATAPSVFHASLTDQSGVVRVGGGAMSLWMLFLPLLPLLTLHGRLRRL